MVVVTVAVPFMPALEVMHGHRLAIHRELEVSGTVTSRVPF